MLHLDDLDVKIIRELGSPSSPQWNLRESYANISRKLGVDEETVRLRVKRVKERGFLPAWRLMVNPNLLNLRAVTVELDVDGAEEGKEKAISQLELVDGVTKIIDFNGKGLLVTVYSEKKDDDGELLSRRIRLIESICGSQKLTMFESRFPRPDVRMRKIDWQIVGALREDARQDLEDVAVSLRVSARTVQRRLSAMREGKAVYLSGAPNVGAAGGLMCCFLVFSPDRMKKRAVDHAIHSDFNRIGTLDTSPEEYSVFGRHCENLADADNVLEKLRAIDGVQNTRMHIMKKLILVQDWLWHEIDR
ncbi:MAG TPA: Lrp/AsnC family transcriptional regulator [Nitrososphaerales archaeon]|nr:Lrp/AsnC family transcriptional regulator [Nitrososphaerales archaeon]